MKPLARMHHLDVGEVRQAHDLRQKLETGRNHGLRGDDGGQDGNDQTEIQSSWRNCVEEWVCECGLGSILRDIGRLAGISKNETWR